MEHSHGALMVALALAACAAAPALAADAVKGQALYQARCAACHAFDYNGVGPAHRGVFGRRAGSAPGYAYSAALQASTIVWGDKTLERWLRNPEQLVPGQKMGVSVVSAQDRADLIAYLKRESGAAPAQ